MKLTKEESVYVEQLAEIKKKIEIFEIEKETHTDRLLTIMRGHGARTAYTHDRRFEIMKYAANGKEGLLILSKP